MPASSSARSRSSTVFQLQQLRRRRVEHLELRIEPRLHGVRRSSCVQNEWIVLIRAASIDRISRCHAAASAGVGRRLQPLEAAAANAVAHLAGRRVGERDRHQLLKPARVDLRRIDMARNRSVSTNVLPHPAPADERHAAIAGLQRGTLLLSQRSIGGGRTVQVPKSSRILSADDADVRRYQD